jgi:hypothetical protein
VVAVIVEPERQIREHRTEPGQQLRMAASRALLASRPRLDRANRSNSSVRKMNDTIFPRVLSTGLLVRFDIRALSRPSIRGDQIRRLVFPTSHFFHEVSRIGLFDARVPRLAES